MDHLAASSIAAAANLVSVRGESGQPCHRTLDALSLVGAVPRRARIKVHLTVEPATQAEIEAEKAVEAAAAAEAEAEFNSVAAATAAAEAAAAGDQDGALKYRAAERAAGQGHAQRRDEQLTSRKQERHTQKRKRAELAAAAAWPAAASVPRSAQAAPAAAAAPAVPRGRQDSGAVPRLARAAARAGGPGVANQ